MSSAGQWVCYILRCADDTLYTGITNDIAKRTNAHNDGSASKYTRSRIPVELIYLEPCANRSEASKREMVIKKLSRSEKILLCNSLSITRQYGSAAPCAI